MSTHTTLTERLAAEPLRGPIIVTRFLGPTNCRSSRVVGTHRYDGETTIRVCMAWEHCGDVLENHRRAALAVLERWPYRRDEPFVLAGIGADHDAYYWLAVQPWQLRDEVA